MIVVEFFHCEELNTFLNENLFVNVHQKVNPKMAI